jgi:hypothetical protein
VNTAVETAVKDVAEKASTRLTPMLQQFALAAGWPSNVALNLSVDTRGSELHVSYPNELDDQVNNLEYGTPGSAPTSVIRPFVARMGNSMGNILEESVMDIMAEMRMF